VAEGAKQKAEKLAEKASLKATSGLAMLGGSALATTGSLAANAVGAKYAHSASFDQLELNAQHTAKYVAQAVKQGVGEAQAENQPDVVVVNQAACEHPEHERKDGKTWAEHVDAQRAQAAAEHTVA